MIVLILLMLTMAMTIVIIPIDVTLVGIVTDVNNLQYSNAASPFD